MAYVYQLLLVVFVLCTKVAKTKVYLFNLYIYVYTSHNYIMYITLFMLYAEFVFVYYLHVSWLAFLEGPDSKLIVTTWTLFTENMTLNTICACLKQ